MTKPRKLTPTQRTALEMARAHTGELTRLTHDPHGLWTPGHGTFSPNTVNALVAAGYATFVEFRDTKKGRIPVLARVEPR
jgi:hypothetical protein